MKRIIIICEGETERDFCKHVLTPYMAKYKISIEPPLIKKSMGGIVNWNILKKEIEIHLSQSNAIVTTLIDYYGLYKKHEFPQWKEGEAKADKNKRMDFLEQSMKEELDENFRYRFFPYLQLHEFEALLFTDKNVFYDLVPKADLDLKGIAELEKTVAEYDNPEMINNNRDTSPSHRLKRIIKGYNKPMYGHYITEAIGIDKIRKKATRFNNWVEQLIKTEE